MAKHERNTGVAAFHSLVAIMLLLAGGAAIGFGIWLQVSGQSGISELDFNDSTVLSAILRVPTAFIIVGAFILVAGIAALIAMARRCLGVTFRIIYVVMAVLIVAALVTVCVFASIVHENGGHGELKNALREAWELTAREHPEQICEIEAHFQCRGFLDNDCLACPTGLEPGCQGSNFCVKCSSRNNPSKGCYDEVVEDVTRYSLPAAIVSGVAAAIVFIDMLLTCCL